MKEYTSRRTKRLQDKLFESRQKDLKIQRKLLEDSRNGGKSLLSQIEEDSKVKKASSENNKGYSNLRFKFLVSLSIFEGVFVFLMLNTALIKLEAPFTVKAITFLVVLAVFSMPLSVHAIKERNRKE
ncbi:MAG TPA: hypothetical protein VGC17_02270 [Lactovum miscens]|uniref:hypothetical protein n=1 Tax=Lactovum miscens TaxID=190387 RepID=UPI002EDAE2A5